MHSDLAERPTARPEAADAGVTLPSVDALLDDAGTGGQDGQADAGNDAVQVHRLPTVGLPDNALLVAAVQRLVEQKARLDVLARDPRLAGLLPAVWLAPGGRSLDMLAFVQGVLPFLQPGERGETAAVRLPLAHVLGDSRWTLAEVAEPRSLAWFLGSDERATPGTRDHAEALLVGALGLAWMQEGRSRPAFLQAMGATTLAARTSMVGYPDAADLALYQVTVLGETAVWCVHGRRRLRPVLAPWLTIPVLVAHGVAAPQPWPSGLPPVDAVVEALSLARAGRAQPEVDLAKVARKVAEDASGETWQPVSLLQLRTWAPRWRFFLATFVGVPSMLLVAAALALPGAVEAATVAASLGFAAGAIGALAMPWIHARRKHLR